MTDTVRILFVDDHTLFRESVVRLLEREPGLQVVGQCATLTEASAIVRTMPVDVVLLDYDLGEEVGTDFLSVLRQSGSGAKVLMVTGGMGASVTLRAMTAGISGLILKHSDPRDLTEAIRRVAAGQTWWDAAALRALGAQPAASSAPTGNARALTQRQRDVLRGILDGLTNKEIASQVQASESAVKASVQELFLKAGVRTRGQLVRVAIERFSADWLREAK